MDPNWFPSADRPLNPGGGPPWFLVNAVCLSTLLLPPGKLRIATSTPVIIYLASRNRVYSSGSPEEDYMSNINLTLMIAKWIDFVMLGTPEYDVHRVDLSDSSRPLLDEDVSKMTLWQKVKWNLVFWCTMRGTGWDWEVKNVDAVHPTVTRRALLVQEIVGYAKCYLILDLTQHYMFTTPYSRLTDVPEVLAAPLFEQITLGWVTGFRAYAGLAFIYHLCAMVGVGLCIYTPQEWPPPFGSFSQAYKLRKFWGYCWHQYLRRTFTTGTSFITSTLGVKKGTLASRYLQLYGSFLISACIHHAGALNVPYSAHAKDQFAFFVGQSIAITLEDFGIYIGKQLGVGESAKTRAIGYLWVFGWFSYSLRYMAALELSLGMGAVRHPMIWSIADRVL